MRYPGLLLAAILLTACARAAPPTPAVTSAYNLPAATVLHRIAFGSCLDQDRPHPILETVKAGSPDLFLFAGDNVYGDKRQGRWLRQADQAALDRAYDKLSGSQAFRRFADGLPILATWDDHDYGLNDAGVELPIKESSKQALLDFFQVPADVPVRARPGLYQARHFGPPGRRVQVILLDTRWFRSRLRKTDQRGAPGRERYLPDTAPAKTMLGPSQWRWLSERLREPAELRLIVSSIQIIANGHGYERWGNLPNERQRFYDLLAESGAGNVVVLSGDRHIAGLYRKHLPNGGILHEITSSSLNRAFVRHPKERGPRQLGPMVGTENYGTIDIDWSQGLVTLAIRGRQREVLREIELDLTAGI